MSYLGEAGWGSRSCFHCKLDPPDPPSETGDHKLKGKRASRGETCARFPSADANDASRLIVSSSRYPNLTRRLCIAWHQYLPIDLRAASVCVDLYQRIVDRRRQITLIVWEQADRCQD